MNSRCVILILVFKLTFMTTYSIAQSIDPPFDVREVITEVSSYSRSSRDSAFLMDTHILYGPASDNQDYPAIAFDGINYLVVWLDDRTAMGIFGTRVNQSGVVLDTAGIVISDVPGPKAFPSVAFGDSTFLVVWSDDSGYMNEDIYGARVTTSGTVLDPNGIAISAGSQREHDPAVAYDGTNFLVVWSDDRNSLSHFDLYCSRVSPSGMVLDPQGIALSTAEDLQGESSIVFDGINYFIVWTDLRNWLTSQIDVYGARVTPSGTVLDPNGISISVAPNVQGGPAIAFDGVNYLVTWLDKRSGLYDIYCSRVSQSGIVLDPAGIPIYSTGDSWQWSIAMAFDGTNYLVVWHDDQGGLGFYLYGARVNQSGTVIDTAGIVISDDLGSPWNPAVAFDGTNYQVVWGDLRGFSSDIYGARTSTSGYVLDPDGIPVSTGANGQDFSSVAFDGTNYFVVWEDNRSGSLDIYGTRINQSGVVLDPECVTITNEPNAQSSPAVAFNGTHYLVVWQDKRAGYYDSDIYATRVDQTGSVLDTNGIAITTAPSYQIKPTVSADGINYFVAWTDRRNSSSYYDIYGTRVAPSGAVLDPGGIAISIAPNEQLLPIIIFGTTEYFVVWQDHRNETGTNTNPDIYGTRIDQSGSVLDPDGIPISTAWGNQRTPRVSFDNTNFFVAWADWYDFPPINPTPDIFGTRVDQAGTVLDSTVIAISTAGGFQGEPSVTFDGGDFLAAWRDNRYGSSHDIRGARINTSGIVVDSFDISLQPGNQFRPAIAHGVGNQALITWSGWTDSISNHAVNALRIWGRFYPLSGIMEETDWALMGTGLNLQVYPNPFNNLVNIRYSSGANIEHAELKIYDVSGRLLKKYSEPSSSAGVESPIIWDGTDQTGRQVPSGVYFLELQSGNYSSTKKLLLIR